MKAQVTECINDCPVGKAAEIVEGKWTTLIIRDLLSGKKRYSDLQKSLVGVSPKVLAARLRFLAEKGLIKRTVYPTVPPTTEYELTGLGMQFNKVIHAIAEFGGLL